MADPITNAITSIVDEIPGVSVIEDVLSQLDQMAKEVTKFAGEIGAGHGHKALEQLLGEAGHAAKGIESLTKLSWNTISQYGAGTMFREYLQLGLGLDPDKMGSGAQAAIKTIDTMLTFSTVLPLSITAVDAILDFWLGQRAPKLKESFLGKVSEELGLTWAMGMTIDRAFETAVGNKLEEAILYQKRPIDPEIQTLRLMLRQHLIGENTLLERAKHFGYSDDWADKFAKLADSQIPVGDLQQLYLHEMLDAGQLDPYLEELGFSPADRKLLIKLYIDKAETSAGAYLRNVARGAFEKDLISIADYEQIQTSTNMPARELADDLRALAMEKDLGRILTPLSALKLQYQHGDLIADTVRPPLKQLGYTDQAITDLLKAWDEPKLPHPMSAAKVLSYWYSGVITDRHDAEGRLLATGLRPQDADFLLDHPSAAGARKHALTPALVTQAFLDGVIDQGSLSGAYDKAGVGADSIGYLTQVALFRKSRQKRPANATVPLSAGQVLDAFKVGVYDPHSTQAELEKLGYSPEDALTLIEIKTKGENPFLKGAAAPFPNLEAAIAYMEAHGFHVSPPPDPMLTAAEQMVLQAGWTYSQSGPGIAGQPPGIPGVIPPGSGSFGGGTPTVPGPFPGSGG